MKKRSCRRTKAEDRAHDEAVRIRKMTDEQLLGHIRDKENAGYLRGYQKAKEELTPAENEMTAGEFLRKLSSEQIPGIGTITLNKLWRFADSNGCNV